MTYRGKRRAIAATAAVGMAVTTLAFGTGQGQAATLSKTLNYSCNIPIVGVTTIPIKINMTFPDTITAGDTFQGQASTDISVPANIVAAMPIIGATQADLSSTLHSTWSGAITGLLDASVSATGQKPPASGAWVITVPATVPPVLAPNAGTATLTAGAVDVTLTPRTAAGALTGLGVVNTTCSLVAGQDATLASLTINAPAPVTTAPPVTQPPTTPPPATTAPPVTQPPTTPPTTAPTTAPTTQPTTAPSTAPSTAPTTAATTVPAPPPGPISITFDLLGKTKIKKLGAEVPIGPGTLTATLDLATGAVSGNLQLPDSTPVKLKVLGLPLSSNISLKQVGTVEGSFVDGVVNTKAQANLSISNLKLGRISLLKGSCTTVKPVKLDLTSAPGFSPIAGGTVSGTYTIPKFGGCGFIGLFVNLLIPGAGNTIDISLTPHA